MRTIETDKTVLRWGIGNDEVVLVTIDLPVRERVSVMPVLRLLDRVVPVIEEENALLKAAVNQVIAQSKARLEKKLVAALH